MLKRMNVNSLGEPVGPYSHATIFNNLVFVSGLTATGSIAASGDMREQIREIFCQLDVVLTEANSDLSRILKVTLFVRDFAQLAQVRTTLFELYADNIPASSAVAVADLFDPNAKIEIEAIAACKTES